MLGNNVQLLLLHVIREVRASNSYIFFDYCMTTIDAELRASYNSISVWVTTEWEDELYEGVDSATHLRTTSRRRQSLDRCAGEILQNLQQLMKKHWNCDSDHTNYTWNNTDT